MAGTREVIDWHDLVDHDPAQAAVNTRARLKWVLMLFVAAAALVFARAVQLELRDGAQFRQLAIQPRVRTLTLPAARGRILARDGRVLAEDRTAQALAVQYPYLRDPPDAAWLRRQARSRLSRAERREPQRVAAMEAQVRDELAAMRRRLAQLCGVSEARLRYRAARIEHRVEGMAAHVNRRRQEQFHARQESLAEQSADEVGLATILAGLFAPPEPLPPPRLTIAEETAYHRLIDDVPPEVAAQIAAEPQAFPGVKIVEDPRRAYPDGALAANLLGHVGQADGANFAIAPAEANGEEPAITGLLGIELAFDAALRGTPGLERQSTRGRGELLSREMVREPQPGRDITLTIDAQLQRAAEQMLDRALRRSEAGADEATESTRGGALVVMDVHTGELLAAASAPRFDPNWFVVHDPRLEQLLADPRRPLFDRVARMALPPGSVFKTLTSLALLARGLDAHAPFRCAGYLDEPDRMRCQLFRQHGIGHGDVMLSDALAQSCNVYFFHHAKAAGPNSLLDWAVRCGFGQASGVELADEAAGLLPPPEQLRQDRQCELFAIGQGALTATPLQVVRLYAAVANGGFLVRPRLVRDASAPSPAQAIPAVDKAMLEVVREGLRRVVEDPAGTAYASVRLPHVAIAGKTGTAETGGHRPDHSWFAGYVPADAPRFAFVVVLEHAGSGAAAAGSVAQLLVRQLQQLGYLEAAPVAQNPLPPGKG